MTMVRSCIPPGRDATRVDVRFTAFSLKMGALPALSLPLDLFSPTGAPSTLSSWFLHFYQCMGGVRGDNGPSHKLRGFNCGRTHVLVQLSAHETLHLPGHMLPSSSPPAGAGVLTS